MEILNPVLAILNHWSQEEEESGSDGEYDESLESSDSDPGSPNYSPEVSHRQRLEKPTRTRAAMGEIFPPHHKV
jgi:hypothetical protein